ncbi:MAG: 50S ribosomal protein L25 [Deinococcales bacterium]|nr:50S ribosomal protein L25 [Deinococcales bacterium]
MELKGEIRTPGKAGSLRQAGRLPGIIYNKDLNLTISVDLRTFDRAFRDNGTANLIDLEVDGKTHPVLIKAVQMDKRLRRPSHVDFFAVTAGQAVTVSVPLDYVGTSVGVAEGGQLDIARRELQLNVLPRLIPSQIEVDISELNIGDSVHINDLASSLFPEGAEVVDDGDLTLITVVPPRVEEVEEPVSEFDAEAEPEVIGRGAEDEEDGESTDENSG